MIGVYYAMAHPFFPFTCYRTYSVCKLTLHITQPAPDETYPELTPVVPRGVPSPRMDLTGREERQFIAETLDYKYSDLQEIFLVQRAALCEQFQGEASLIERDT